ncbi:MAG: hypothetical protein ACUVRM_01630 [Bacillota bacterium]
MVFLLLFSAFVGLVLLLLTKELIPRSPTGGTEKTAPPNPLPVTNGEDASLAEELAAILSQVAGAGRVEVRLTFEASTAREWEENRRRNRRTSEERTKEGNLQITSEETEETTLAVVRKADGSETLVEKAARMPVVAGAIVVAEGAADPEIRAELARATATFLHIGLHRVVVLPRKEEKGR